MHQSFEVFWRKIRLNYPYDFMNIFLYMMDFFSMINKNRVGSLSVFIFNGDNIFIYHNFILYSIKFIRIGTIIIYYIINNIVFDIIAIIIENFMKYGFIKQF